MPAPPYNSRFVRVAYITHDKKRAHLAFLSDWSQPSWNDRRMVTYPLCFVPAGKWGHPTKRQHLTKALEYMHKASDLPVCPECQARKDQAYPRGSVVP